MPHCLHPVFVLNSLRIVTKSDSTQFGYMTVIPGSSTGLLWLTVLSLEVHADMREWNNGCFDLWCVHDEVMRHACSHTRTADIITDWTSITNMHYAAITPHTMKEHSGIHNRANIVHTRTQCCYHSHYHFQPLGGAAYHNLGKLGHTKRLRYSEKWVLKL